MPRTVTHDLRVLGATPDGSDLVIDLYGGPSNACGSVRFTFDSQAALLNRWLQVQTWAAVNRPMALIEDDGQIVLMDERHLADDTREEAS